MVVRFIQTISKGCRVLSPIELIEPDKNQVRLRKENQILSYDYLVVATGSQIKPAETPGLLGPEWHNSIHDFYTVEGALALQKHLRTWEGGRLALNITEMPIKCPVAPLEFLFLADSFFHDQTMRDRVELTLVTPLSGAFTKPKAAALLGGLLEEKGIHIVPDFNIERVGPDEKAIYSYDERKVEYDLLISVPTNMGDEVIERSGMGDELNFIPTEKHTLKAKEHDNIFVLGDATDLPSSKAGSVAHFQVDGFIKNFRRYVEGRELLPTFDGHANCYIESGFGKGILIDFNYDVEPLPGKYPPARSGSVYTAPAIPSQPLGQNDVPLDLLEYPAQGQEVTSTGTDEHGRQMELGG